MALVVKDRVRQFTTTTGTGTVTLSGSITGFQSFSSALSDGDTTYYALVDSASGDYEVGIGTFSSSGETLSRDTVLESSNAGSAVNFGAGSKEVFITYPAEKSVKLDANGYIESADGRNLSNVTAASYTVTSGDVTTALGYTPVQPGDNVSTLTNDSGYLTTVAFGDLTSTPTTLSGYGITDAATSAQGSLADSAVQPGDNISTLTNNAGYITSADGGDADTVDGIQASSFVRGDGVNNGSVTIEADDSDFVVRDGTDSPTNFIWRDHSDSKLYLGTGAAVATLRSTLDLNSNNITNGGSITATSFSGDGSSVTNVDADTVDGIQGSALVTTTTITNHSLNPKFSSTIGFGNDSEVLRFNDSTNETRSDWWSSKDGFYIQGDSNNVDNVVLKSGYLDLSQNAFIEGKLGVDSGITEGVYNLTGTQLNPINGGIQYKTLGANTTFSEALTDGESLILRLDGGATYTVTWPTITWIGSGGNVAPTLNGTKDTFVFWQESNTFYGAYIGYGA